MNYSYGSSSPGGYDTFPNPAHPNPTSQHLNPPLQASNPDITSSREEENFQRDAENYALTHPDPEWTLLLSYHPVRPVQARNPEEMESRRTTGGKGKSGQLLDPTRRCNVRSALVHRRGEEMPLEESCETCKTDTIRGTTYNQKGKAGKMYKLYTGCVRLRLRDGTWFNGGECTNCMWGNQGSTCSLKVKKTQDGEDGGGDGGDGGHVQAPYPTNSFSPSQGGQMPMQAMGYGSSAYMHNDHQYPHNSDYGVAQYPQGSGPYYDQRSQGMGGQRGHEQAPDRGSGSSNFQASNQNPPGTW